MKGKELVGDEEVIVSVSTRHPLAGFTKPMTSLECRRIGTYHRFKVSKKGDTKGPIIFHALGNIDRRCRQGDKDSRSISIAVPETTFPQSQNDVPGDRFRSPSVKRLPEDPTI